LTVGYRLVVPHPWEQVALDSSLDLRVKEIVSAAAARVPKDIPPDQVGPAIHRLEHDLAATLRDAQDKGVIDYYLPTDLMHGQQLNANFVVGTLIPDAMADDELVPRVLATMLKEPGSSPVTIGDSVWVRRERLRTRPPGGLVDAELGVREVEYLSPVHGDPRRWVVVTFTTLGDGDPHSENTDLVVELFDAIMSTWRWVQDGTPVPGVPTTEGTD